MKKKLEELNLLDDFLFGTMMSHPVYGEPFARILVKIILGRDLKILKIVSQMNYYGQDTDRHGARLDVYIEEADGSAQGGIQTGNIYDIEPDQGSGKSERAVLPRRVRFYRSVTDAHNLKSGADYSRLKDVIVIMLLPYDPFGRGRTLYTVKNTCLEEPEMPYEDGALNLFLYTKGTDKTVPQELRDLLQYLENTTWDNAVNDSLREIQAMVDNVKHDKEVSISYMKIYERERMIRNEGRSEGFKEGRKEGIMEGRKEGLADSVEYLLSELGTLPENIAARISNEKSPDILNRWLKLAAKSNSIEEFTQKM